MISISLKPLIDALVEQKIIGICDNRSLLRRKTYIWGLNPIPSLEHDGYVVTEENYITSNSSQKASNHGTLFPYLNIMTTEFFKELVSDKNTKFIIEYQSGYEYADIEDVKYRYCYYPWKTVIGLNDKKE